MQIIFENPLIVKNINQKNGTGFLCTIDPAVTGWRPG